MPKVYDQLRDLVSSDSWKNEPYEVRLRKIAEVSPELASWEPEKRKAAIDLLQKEAVPVQTKQQQVTSNIAPTVKTGHIPNSTFIKNTFIGPSPEEDYIKNISKIKDSNASLVDRAWNSVALPFNMAKSMVLGSEDNPTVLGYAGKKISETLPGNKFYSEVKSPAELNVLDVGGVAGKIADKVLPGEENQGYRGVAKGVGNTISGLTSLPNVAIVATTGGLGKLGHALLGGYFTAEMAKGVYEGNKELKNAADAGDFEKASEIATSMIIGAPLTYLAARGTVKDGKTLYDNATRVSKMQNIMKERLKEVVAENKAGKGIDPASLAYNKRNNQKIKESIDQIKINQQNENTYNRERSDRAKNIVDRLNEVKQTIPAVNKPLVSSIDLVEFSRNNNIEFDPMAAKYTLKSMEKAINIANAEIARLKQEGKLTPELEEGIKKQLVDAANNEYKAKIDGTSLMSTAEMIKQSIDDKNKIKADAIVESVNKLKSMKKPEQNSLITSIELVNEIKRNNLPYNPKAAKAVLENAKTAEILKAEEIASAKKAGEYTSELDNETRSQLLDAALNQYNEVLNGKSLLNDVGLIDLEPRSRVSLNLSQENQNYIDSILGKTKENNNKFEFPEELRPQKSKPESKPLENGDSNTPPIEIQAEPQSIPPDIVDVLREKNRQALENPTIAEQVGVPVGKVEPAAESAVKEKPEMEVRNGENILQLFARSEEGSLPIKLKVPQIQVESTFNKKKPVTVSGAKGKIGEWIDNKIIRYVSEFRAIEKLVKQFSSMEERADTNPLKKIILETKGVGGKIEDVFMDYDAVISQAYESGLTNALTEYLAIKSRVKVWENIGGALKEKNEAVLKLSELINSLKAELSNPNTFNKGKEYYKAIKENYNKAISSKKILLQEIAGIQKQMKNKNIVDNSDTLGTLTKKMNDLAGKLSPEQLNKTKMLAEEIFGLNRRALDLAKNEGLISEAEYSELLSKSDEYVPATRQVDKKSIFKNDDPTAYDILNHSTGGSREILDPIESSMNRHARILKLVAKNRSVKGLVEWMIEHQRANPDINLIRQALPNGKVPAERGIIQYLENGEVKRFEVDVAISDTIKHLDVPAADMLGKAYLQLAAQLFKAGATVYNLPFSAVNPIKDIANTLFTSRSIAGLKDAVSILPAWLEAIKSQVDKSPAYREYLNSGAYGSTLQTAIDSMATVNKSGLMGKIQTATIGKIAKLNTIMEQATKIAAYEKLRKKGYSVNDAAWETRAYSGSPDFSQMGRMSPLLNLAFMFSNAAIQGTKQNIQAAIRDPKRMMKILMAFTAAQTALSAWNSQFKNEITHDNEMKHTTDFERENYTIVYLPGTYRTDTGNVRQNSVKIPKSFFMKMFLNPIEEAVDAIAGNYDYDPQQVVLNTLSRLSPFQMNLRRGSVVSDAINGVLASTNTAAQLPLSVVTNTNFQTGRPIIPEWQKGLIPTEQKSPTNSKFSQIISNKFNVSPTMTDHVLRLGGTGVAETITNMSNIWRDGKKSELFEGNQEISNIPGIGLFGRRFTGSPSDKVLNNKLDKFYTLKNNYDQIANTASMYKKSNPDKFSQFVSVDDNANKIIMSKEFNKAAKQIREIKNSNNSIIESDIPLEDKKSMLRENFININKILDDILNR